MSQTFSPTRNSPSSDDPENDYHSSLRRFPFPPQPRETSSSQPASSATSFASQNSEVSIANSVTSPEVRPTRTLDVSTILNPTPPGTVDSPRPRPISHFGSPISSIRPSTQHEPGRPHASSPGGLGTSDRGLRGPDTFPRRIPASGPTRSHMSRNSISGLVSAHSSPFVYGSPRRSNPLQAESLQPSHNRSRAPPPPAPPPSGPSPTGYFPPVSTPIQHYSPAPRFSIGGTPLSSASASPVSSFASSYGQPGQSPLSTAPTFTAAPFQSMPGTPVAGSQSEGLQYTLAGPSAHSAAQGNSFPMMRFDTAQGTMQIPIDTTAASRSADEKRRRNAGASARFRARRKEREREMSQRIAELEQRVKKAEDERDHYRNLWRQQNQREPPPPPVPHTAGIVRGDVSREGFGRPEASGLRVERERMIGHRGSGISGMNPEEPRRGFGERESHPRQDSPRHAFDMRGGQQQYRKERE